MKSVMQHTFAKTPTVSIPRSTFLRPHGHKTTFDAGKLVPIFTDIVYPGDTANLRTSGFARLATPEFPVMDNMYLDTFYFAIPIRLLWENFRKFCGEQEDPTSSIDYTLPTMTTTHTAGSLGDYFGLPIGISVEVQSLYHRAYSLVWNEWFRDQNLQNSPNVPVDDGPDVAGTDLINVLKSRGKRHDYFTSCLPWPQKQTDTVAIPYQNDAPIYAEGGAGQDLGIYDSTNTAWRKISNDPAEISVTAAPSGMMYADMTSDVLGTINDLRESFQIQRLLEKDARSGSRYAELVNSHFGVKFADVTYRPEYLGGGSTPINITPVAETAAGSAGELGAMGTASINGHGFVKSFTEHCLILGLCNARADLTYSQGIRRDFSYSTRYDFYWPSLAQIGEQAVLNKEIYYQGTSADDEVFGYNERYSEMRYKPSMITGQFRSNHATPLDAWHLSEEFTSLPTLGDTFIQDDPPIDRVIATPTEPHFIADFYFDYKMARPMPLYGTPGMIDHF